MRENNSGFKIDESQRQSWLSIAAVWAGGMICVPCLMIGGVLAGGGLSLGQIVLSILIGYGLICVYMICIGMQACDTGLPVSVMASGALGEKGRTLYYQRASCDCLRWLVRYPVCHLRQRLCQHGSQYAGNGGDSDFYLYQLYRLGALSCC